MKIIYDPEVDVLRILFQEMPIHESDEDGYYAYCPALESGQTQGDSLEEVHHNIQEAIALYLSTL
ncbi:MAG: type II toxin-antitoxin system HicB family antitoxin [Oscillatoriales cyanobacterium SM2_1_8]|nr:type II toxin-antitoxin system HicB family antitoxin [Oscillatoriales cyanobacterium SM2_1_8]